MMANSQWVLDDFSTSGSDDESNETVKGAASTPKALASLSNLGVDRMEQGAIGGLTGVILNEASRRGFDAMALLAECSGPMQGMGPDARTAARVLGSLDELLPAIKLDSEPLLKEARRIEGEINEMMSGSVNQPPGSTSGGSTSMFG